MIPLICHPLRAAFAIAFLIAIVANSFAIDFDNTFGSGGKFTTSFATTGEPSGGGLQLFVQPSGRIVILGSHSQQGATGRTVGISLAGLTPGGVLDTGFGTGGKVLLWSSTFQRLPNNALMTSDGSLIVLYQFWESASSNRPTLIKFTPDGQPDSNFTADLDIVPNQTSPVRIAQAGGGRMYVLVRSGTQFNLIRLNGDGSRDTTFAPNGVRQLNLNRFYQPTVFELKELENGKLLVGGRYYDPTFQENTFVARFDSDTNLDRSFGLQGAVRISIPDGSAYSQVTVIQPDGKLVLGGAWTFLGSNTLLMRLTPRGRFDVTFGTRGMTMTTFNDTNLIRGIALAPDGKMIVVGASGDKALPSNQRLFVMRYSSAGVRESFLVTSIIPGREATASDVMLQPDGKMLIAGAAQNASDNSYQLAAARFIP